MDLLLELAQPARLDSKIELGPGKYHVAITFDDAYRSTIENALPELRSRHIPGTVFVVSHMAGQSPWWAGTEGFDRDEKFIGAKQLATLSDNLVTVGSHTMTHSRLTAISTEEAGREVAESRRSLQTATAQEVRFLAFPHGEFNDEIVDLCREAGYERVFSCMPSVSTSPSTEYVMGRVLVDPTDWEIEFRLKVLGAYRWLPAIYRLKKMIVHQFRWTAERSSTASRTGVRAAAGAE